ncbi:YSIRK-type signal peptide-containing protein [Vaginisenegalia massiliensis]|uniref:YSIRK-type signal peptide-containing protein n=1 Tax=Vaginisenegalia massiliensis TaxID=2058294 RepID=UPI000F530907|nr:YSIRK-type signal peptide-containing protein [Vaginisenegalia massiliensis]
MMRHPYSQMSKRVYSLRKLKVGLASVAVGLTFFGMGQEVQAQESTSSVATPDQTETNSTQAVLEESVVTSQAQTETVTSVSPVLDSEMTQTSVETTSETVSTTEVVEANTGVAPIETKETIQSSSTIVREETALLSGSQVKNGLVVENGQTVYYKDGQRVYDQLIVDGNKKYYFDPQAYDGGLAKNKWAYSPSTYSWYYADETGQVTKEVTPLKYLLQGIQQFDCLVTVDANNKFYFEPKAYGGVMARNKWSYSPSTYSWYKALDTAQIVQEVTPNGYWERGVRKYDQLVTVDANNKFYFEPKAYGGVMARNKWSYSPSTYSWYHAKDTAQINQEVTPKGYWENGLRKYDQLVTIDANNKFYFEPQFYGGAMARNKWAYSPSTYSWYHAKETAQVDREVTPQAYLKDGIRQYDVLVDVNGQKFYFDPKAYGGAMARNKWAYSPSANAWYHAPETAVIDQQVTPVGYWVNGIQQFDKKVSVNNFDFYFQPKAQNGFMARNQWAWSPANQTWYYAYNNYGHINQSLNNNGYYLDKVKQYDAIVTINNKRYYVQTRPYKGALALNKWSYSDKNKAYYLTDGAGVITQVDTTGSHLPKVVTNDKGTYIYSYADTGWDWDTGCYIRAAASGVEFAGGHINPQQLLNALPKTNDPRTGVIGSPTLMHNWGYLQGAYSQAFPEAMVPVLKKFAPNTEDLTGISLEGIKQELANGNAVQVFYARTDLDITIYPNGQPVKISDDYHSILLTGYNADGFFHQENVEPIRNRHVGDWYLRPNYARFGYKAIGFRPK